MRIIASNPDTLGDLVLRQPMYRALQDAGHQLMLIVRSAVAPLVRHVAPGADVIELPHEVYAPDLPAHWDKFNGLFASAEAFRPDLLLVAPYRWTLFDEELSRRLTGLPVAGLDGHLFEGDPHHGLSPESRLVMQTVARVNVDEPEYLKNAALAAAVLGQEKMELPLPRLSADPAMIDRASAILQRVEFSPNDYYLACVTGTAHVSLKAWQPDQWAQLLSRWSTATGRRFLFVGLNREEQAATEVRRLMGDAGARSATWMPPGGSIDDLIALASLSAGYAGHDTGPMHVSAALGKPVLAVFGGGHRLRFQPAVEPSVVLTMGVPCAGCAWVCTFAESHCVKAVDVDAVFAAAMDLEHGLITKREARVLTPSATLQARMIAEGAEFSRRELRSRSQVQLQLEQAGKNWSRDVEQLRGQAEQYSNDARRLTTQMEARAAESETFRLALEMKGREADAALVRQEQLDAENRQKELKIHEQHEQLLALQAKLADREEQIEQIRQQRASMSEMELEVQTAREEKGMLSTELNQLRSQLQSKLHETGRFAVELAERHSEMELVRSEINGMIDQVQHSAGASEPLPVTPTDTPQGVLRRWSDEITELKRQVERLEERLRTLEPQPVAPPRSWREIGVQLVIGKKHYIPRASRSLPSVSVVVVASNQLDRLDSTLESILAQNHAHFEVVIVNRGADAGDLLRLVEPFRDRIDQVLAEPETSDGAAISRGMSVARGDVLGVIGAGDEYMPGALLRVAQEFSRRRVHAIEFANAICRNGWRMPDARTPRLGVYELLRMERPPEQTVFFTSASYRALGRIDPTLDEVAWWDWLLRLSRRFGIRQADTHVRLIRHEPTSQDVDRFRNAVTSARQQFEKSFGIAGRIRCTTLDLVHRAARRRSGRRFDFSCDGAAAESLRAAPPLPEPGFSPGQPVSPLSNQLPDRLLFSSPDTLGIEAGSHEVFYDAQSDLTLTYPPAGAGTKPAPQSQPAEMPVKAAASPFAGYRSSAWRGWLSKVPSPYWWVRRPRYDDTFATDALRTLRGLLDRKSSAVRVLNVACYQGAVLDELRARTPWQLAGTETNAAAISMSRDKGYRVWETSAQDAALTLPVGETFDVILVSHLMEHLQNPLLVLRRLRQLLRPAGWLVFDSPNLDSRHIDIFGPTWGGWQTPHHRVLMGRRAVRQMAKLADFRVHTLLTRTHPYPTCRSVLLNQLGLCGVVPDGARFDDRVASQGVRLTGWSRLLWDWRGRGDFLLAVLQQQ